MADTSRAALVRRMFDEAAGLPPAGRAAFLAQHCADDRALFDHLQSLLLHDDQASTAFFDIPKAADADSAADHPQQLGRYRILSVLGHGGMGTVYEAEQDRPQRKVALKVVRAGWMTPSMLRRFEYEA